jgi:hypothetical protein
VTRQPTNALPEKVTALPTTNAMTGNCAAAKPTSALQTLTDAMAITTVAHGRFATAAIIAMQKPVIAMMTRIAYMANSAICRPMFANNFSFLL